MWRYYWSRISSRFNLIVASRCWTGTCFQLLVRWSVNAMEYVLVTARRGGYSCRKCCFTMQSTASPWLLAAIQTKLLACKGKILL